ncbi:hypothetical protein BRC68_01275 [Halobacteriales archaeon QH_6_64_20]|nr:MAG: hypothetical protein BRC68_01275 [Halobacteriales archaeon QH_6_64_20]
MIFDRSHRRVVAVAIVVLLASVFVPGALAQEAGQSEGEPNDSPLNATLIGPGVTVNGEVTASENASQADADWFALPVQAGQNVTVTFESGNDSERLLVFLASPGGSGLGGAGGAGGAGNASGVNDSLADAAIAPSGETVQLSTTANESSIYFVGVTGPSGSYEFTVETGNGTAIGVNGTNATGIANATGAANATAANGSTANATMGNTTMANGTNGTTEATSTTATTTATETATATETTTDTTTTTTAATTETSTIAAAARRRVGRRAATVGLGRPAVSFSRFDVTVPVR